MRCEREERIAVVQPKAYWDWFPLLAKETQPGRTQDVENSEEELIEDDGQERRSYSNSGSSDDHNQELIVHKVEAKQNANKANPDRRQYLAELRDRIKAEGEAVGGKRRKLDPTNSGGSPSAINGKVEHASKDLVHERIKGEGQLTCFKRGIEFEASNAERQGGKFQKKEMQSILNLIAAGRTR